MRKLIVEAEVSLDGIVNSPDVMTEIFKYHSKDVTDYLHKLLFSAHALVLGRKTYEVFAKVWPGMDNENAKKINAMPKYVASRTLGPSLEWNATLLKGNVAEEIQRLKQESDKPLIQYGIGELTDTMLKNALVDELQLMVYPFTFGKGERWFDVLDAWNFELLECRSFGSGVILLRYRPK